MARRIHQKAQTSYYDLAYRLHLAQFPIHATIEAELRKRNYFDDGKSHQSTSPTSTSPKSGYLRGTLTHKTEEERIADQDTIVIEQQTPDNPFLNEYLENPSAQTYDALRRTGEVTYQDDIKTSDWKVPVEELENHSPEFISWINSINTGFQNMIPYWRYELYKKQAEQWLEENSSINDYERKEDKINFLFRERQRGNENMIYRIEKYWKRKNKRSLTGFSPIKLWEVHKVAYFLMDSGYDVFFAKPRQIAFTTSIFGYGVNKTLMNKSYFVSIAIADDNKAKKTFNEKIREPYYELDKTMRPAKPANDTERYMQFYKNRHEQEGGGSMISIATASPTLVNSGTPAIFIGDEVGLMDCLSEMIEEWMPTSDEYSDETGRIEKINQIILLGTSDAQEFPDFEVVFTQLMRDWEARNFFKLIIPIFFNWAARKGMTQEKYNALKRKYDNYQGQDKEMKMRKFKQAYPDTIEDMFISNPSTMIHMDEIRANIKRINNAPVEDQVRHGYFIPIYDPIRTERIINANFHECEDQLDPKVTTVIYRLPEKDWMWRYFKGTDPIANATGLSRFATAIDDVHLRTIAAGQFTRPTDHRFAFEQSLCLHLFYNSGMDYPVQDLIENNQGQNYIDYVQGMGYGKLILPKVALPRWLQTGSANPDGIDNKGNSNQYIMQEISRMFDMYKKNIWISNLFVEAKTFLRKKDSIDVFKVKDPRYYFDDFIFACTYARICANVFAHKTPQKRKSDDEKKELVWATDYDDNWNLIAREAYEHAA